MKVSSGRSAPTAGSSTLASAVARSGTSPSNHAAVATLATRENAPKAASAPCDLFRPASVGSSAIPTPLSGVDLGEQPTCHRRRAPPPRAGRRGGQDFAPRRGRGAGFVTWEGAGARATRSATRDCGAGRRGGPRRAYEAPPAPADRGTRLGG